MLSPSPSDGHHQPPEKLACWHNCDRRQAAQLLLSGACRPGTYLLRPCHSRVERYALSVLHEKQPGGIRGLLSGRRHRQPVVRNYLIREKKGGYCIFGDQCFEELHRLIAFYAKPRRRMSAALRYPFPRSDTAEDGVRRLRVDKGNRLRHMQKIGEGSFEMFSADLNGRHVISLLLDGGQEVWVDGRAAAAAAAAADDDKAKPPLPPRPPSMASMSLTVAVAAVGKKPDNAPGEQQRQICLQKTATSEAVGPAKRPAGSGGGGRWTSLARDRLERCSRIVEVMLQRLLK